MLGWILAAVLGAIPLYFGFQYGRARRGMALLTGIGALLSGVVLGLVLATSGGGETVVLGGLGLAYFAGIGVMAAVLGGLATLVFGPLDDADHPKSGRRK